MDLNWRRFKKFIAAALSSLTAGGVIAIAAAFGATVSTELAAAIVGAAGALAVLLGPANQETAPTSEEVTSDA